MNEFIFPIKSDLWVNLQDGISLQPNKQRGSSVFKTFRAKIEL